MPIDFFLAPCTLPQGNCQLPGIVCKSATRNIKFGICDDPPPSTMPAYIKLYHPDDWIAIVQNQNSKEINFKAIDNCVQIFRPDGQLESRCDGMLFYENNLIFVELKDRASGGWLSKGREQITITIDHFRAIHNINSYDKVEAYVCNKQRPLALTNNNAEVQKFKDETGFLLIASRNISV